MTIESGHQTFPAVEHLVRKIEALETLIGELITRKLPAVEMQLDGLRDLLANRRKDHLSVEEVAELTGRSAYTVRRWISESRLKAIRIEGTGPKGRLLIRRAEFERLIAAGLGNRIPDAVVE